MSKKDPTEKPLLSWEETVLLLQSKPEFGELMANTYLDKDLFANASRYHASEEFRDILEILSSAGIQRGRLLDVGAGNGICSIAFAREGWDVTAVEPDPGMVTGRGAIARLKEHSDIDSLVILDGTGESLPFSEGTFDVVFVRQAFHHAADLKRFAAECLRVLAPGGILLGIREHVVFNSRDKRLFFEQHPMHKHYGGENAYRLREYLSAFEAGNGTVERVLRYFDSPVNYFPLQKKDIEKLPEFQLSAQDKRLRELVGSAADVPLIRVLYRIWIKLRAGGPYDERRLPGRMYSFVVRKKAER
jgi:SAM-dependent methyltransferase